MNGVRSYARVNRRPEIDAHRRIQPPSSIGQSGIAAADPVHHRERGLRALQLLRDAQHPDAVPGHARCCCTRRKPSAPAIAKEVFHSFVIGVYFFPLLGGWLADRFFGKYRTILWLSLVYCVGHACLALFDDNRTGFYTGLFLIALGSGGIKPLRRVVRRRSVRSDRTSTSRRSCSTPSTGSSTSARSSPRC